MLLESIYFVFPAYFANMAPVIAKKMKFLNSLNIPLDHGRRFMNKPLLGKHKTYRGLLLGVAFAIIAAALQKILYPYPFFRSISITDYHDFLIIGFLLGIGAIIGDMIKSFFKRRLGILPGKRFVPFDQLDFIIGAYLALLLFYPRLLTIELFLYSVIASFFLHIIVNHAAYYIGIRKEKW